MQEAFVLHSLAWRETSLVVEVFTRAEGRLGLVARGARRPRSAMRGLLQPFQPILVRYGAKGELRTLMSAEWSGGLGALAGEALLAGFYLNELVLKLLAREDPHPALFDAYRQAIHFLAAGASSTAAPRSMRGARGRAASLIEPVLRQFECRLLREIGVAPDFSAPLYRDQPDRLFEVRAGETIRPCMGPSGNGDAVSGRVIHALSRYDDGFDAFASAFFDVEVAAEAKRLLRGLLRHQLGESELLSREAMRELHRLTEPSGRTGNGP
ncbi:MAG: repair protein [Pseudomonadota bacterium]|jgi:DNA repair protein RecO (recombination protein O)